MIGFSGIAKAARTACRGAGLASAALSMMTVSGAALAADAFGHASPGQMA